MLRDRLDATTHADSRQSALIKQEANTHAPVHSSNYEGEKKHIKKSFPMLPTNSMALVQTRRKERKIVFHFPPMPNIYLFGKRGGRLSSDWTAVFFPLSPKRSPRSGRVWHHLHKVWRSTARWRLVYSYRSTECNEDERGTEMMMTCRRDRQ